MRAGTPVRDRTRPQLGLGIAGRPVYRPHEDPTAVWVYWPRGRRRAQLRNLEPVRRDLDLDRTPEATRRAEMRLIGRRLRDRMAASGY